MSNKARPLGRKGFTLVELLIVVAIIGVLSTIGVPTFRRMIQKSKKSEAKVNLGGIYTAEQSFVAEYGTFGNNLARMGYETDGKADQMTYVIGFYNGTCQARAYNGGGTITPSGSSGGAGAALNAAYGNYFSNTAGNIKVQSVFGPFNGALDAAGNPVAYQLQANCLAGFGADPANHTWGNTNSTSGSASDQNTFIAVASGVIAPGVNKSNPANAGDVDLWSMDETRLLNNNQDAMK